MDTELKWAWIAGVFDGEGCIAFSSKNSVTLTIGMTDEDVVRRVHEFAELGRVWGPDQRPGNRKPQWHWIVGPRLEVLAVLDRIEPYLGQRRKARALAARERLAGCRPMNVGLCKRYHPLSGDNLYVSPKGQRFCRTCLRMRDRKRVPRNRKKVPL